MASKTGKLILAGAATASLAAGCQTSPLTTAPSMSVDQAATSSQFGVLGETGECRTSDYTVYAQSSTELLHFTGSKNTITGDVHTNDMLKMAGNNDKITGTAGAVDKFQVSGSNNMIATKNVVPLQPEFPVALSPETYTTTADKTFNFTGNINLNDQAHVWDSKGQLKPGIYKTTGIFTLPTTNVKGHVTFIAEGVQLPGKNHNLTPYANGVLIYATGTGNNTVHFSGNSNQYAGLVLAPNGAFQLTGHNNSLKGQVFTDVFKISGSNNTITFTKYGNCPVPEPVATPTPVVTPSPEATTSPNGNSDNAPPSEVPVGQTTASPSPSPITASPTPQPSMSPPPDTNPYTPRT